MPRCSRRRRSDASFARTSVSSAGTKLLWNLPFNPVSVLAGGATTKQMTQRDELEGLCRALMREVIAVANACGVALTEANAEAQIEYTRNFPAYKTSMLQDYEAGRELEVEAILGNAVRPGGGARCSGSAYGKLLCTFEIGQPHRAGREGKMNEKEFQIYRERAEGFLERLRNEFFYETVDLQAEVFHSVDPVPWAKRLRGSYVPGRRGRLLGRSLGERLVPHHREGSGGVGRRTGLVQARARRRDSDFRRRRRSVLRTDEYERLCRELPQEPAGIHAEGAGRRNPVDFYAEVGGNRPARRRDHARNRLALRGRRHPAT